jgi:hypothetical protein
VDSIINMIIEHSNWDWLIYRNIFEMTLDLVISCTNDLTQDAAFLAEDKHHRVTNQWIRSPVGGH